MLRWIRFFSSLLILASIFVIASATTHAQEMGFKEKRIALLIGNTTYAPSPGPLRNATRDVALLAETLKKVGFEVDVQTNLTLVPLRRAISNYTKRMRDAGPGTVGFLYYSGHGAADGENGTNYLIPVDANLDQDDLPATSERLETIIETLSNVTNSVMQFVVFDACRSVMAQGGTRSTARGFEPISQRRGMVIVFSTAPRDVAYDEFPKGSDHGPFASMLAKALASTTVREDTMFTDVQSAVSRLTAGRQSPYVLRSPVREFYFRAPTASDRARSESADIPSSNPAGGVLDQLRSLAKNAALTDADRQRLEAIIGSMESRTQSPRAFKYYAAGDLLGGSGEGSKNLTDYAPHMVFPIANAEAFVNSQVFGYGGAGGEALGGGPGSRGGSEFDARNYAYPWRDNFCELRGFTVPECPSGKGHQGVDIRGGARDPSTGNITPSKGDDGGPVRVVAVEDGILQRVTSGSLVRIVSTDGLRQWTYMQLDPRDFQANGIVEGRTIKAGAVIGNLSNFMNGVPNSTTRHLHFELAVRRDDGWRTVNPYTTLVRAYERVWGTGVQVAD